MTWAGLQVTTRFTPPLHLAKGPENIYLTIILTILAVLLSLSDLNAAHETSPQTTRRAWHTELSVGASLNIHTSS
jgi:hypothetical protein